MPHYVCFYCFFVVTVYSYEAAVLATVCIYARSSIFQRFSFLDFVQLSVGVFPEILTDLISCSGDLTKMRRLQ